MWGNANSKRIDWGWPSGHIWRNPPAPHGILSHMDTAKRKGDGIVLHYVSVGTPARALDRIRNGVALGGHDFPAADVGGDFSGRKPTLRQQSRERMRFTEHRVQGNKGCERERRSGDCRESQGVCRLQFGDSPGAGRASRRARRRALRAGGRRLCDGKRDRAGRLSMEVCP